MFKHFVVALALIVCTGLQARAADSELQQIADALDVSTTKTFQFTANGDMWAVGQNQQSDGRMASVLREKFDPIYDFTAGAMRDQVVRTQGEAPPSGGGGQPLEGDQQSIALVSGDLAWNEAGSNMTPRAHEASGRAHELAISPHGLGARRVCQQPDDYQEDDRWAAR